MYKVPRSTLHPNSHVIIQKDNKILLVLRSGTGCYDGFWCLPSGRVSPSESPIAAGIREAKEEVDLTVDLEHKSTVLAKLEHALNKNKPMYEDLSMFFKATSVLGSEKNMEPSKHKTISWFSINNLPENLVPIVRMGINSYINKQSYVEYGY